MGMAATLVNVLRPFQQSFIPPTQEGSIWNLCKIGPEAPEEKLFEILNIFPIQMHKEAKLTSW